MNLNNGRKFYSVKEVAQMFSENENFEKTIYRWINDKRIPHIRIGGKVFIPKRKFDEFLEKETCIPQRTEA